MSRDQITQAIVRELLDYNPEAGLFTWRWRDLKWFSRGERDQTVWNKRFAGKRAFTTTRHGYLDGHMLGTKVLAHRVAFLWMTGRWPIEVDHKNRIKTDNRWCNLREASRLQNLVNCGLRTNNTSGVTGVWSPWRNGKYVATLAREHLGVFATMEEAIAARQQAERDCWANNRCFRTRSAMQ